MAITLRIPAMIDVALVRLTLAAARTTGSKIQLETFYRIRMADDCFVDCDSQQDVAEFVRGIDLPKIEQAAPSTVDTQEPT